jgi:hypothetical protein
MTRHEAEVIWAVALAHAEHAMAEISAAQRSPDYAEGLADAAAAIRDLPLADDWADAIEV